MLGASDDPRKWGNWIARNALRGEHRRPVLLVNRRAPSVLGRPTFASLADLPVTPELVVLAVPETAFESAIDDALACGARAILGITGGLAETGADGARRERDAAERVREAGAVLLGPNCLGVMAAAAELYLTSNDLPPGTIGLISQSGNLALELGHKAAAVHLGFARFASIGNQADLEAADLVEDFARAPDVAAIAIYCEDYRDGRRFLEAARTAADSGTPVAMIGVGTSEAAARAARSHTGAMVSGRRALAAACRAAGIEQVDTPKELVDLLQGLLGPAPFTGRRVAVLADGGGHGAIAAEMADREGLAVPQLSARVSARLAVATGTAGGTANPVDLAGAGEDDLWSFSRVLDELVGSGEVDAVLLTGYFGGYGTYGEALARTELEVATALGKVPGASGVPLVVHSMFPAAELPAADPAGHTGPLRRLRDAGIPVYPNVEDAAWVVGRLCARARRTRQVLRPLPHPLAGPATDGYFAARELLSSAGFPLVAARSVIDAAGARAAAGELGWPVAVKAVSLEHKSDAGGVVLGVADPEALDRAVSGLWERFGTHPLSVEAMADTAGGVELLVGCVRDPRFGPVVVVGLGGIHAEILTDFAAAVAPVVAEEAEALLRVLRGAPLLTGARGRVPVDLAAAARAVAALSEVAASHPAAAELEVNPLLATPAGAWGLDARLVLAAAPAEPAYEVGSGAGGGLP